LVDSPVVFAKVTVLVHPLYEVALDVTLQVPPSPV
jgi:hypothetical protein